MRYRIDSGKRTFQHAIELDPNFALAYGRLGVAIREPGSKRTGREVLKGGSRPAHAGQRTHVHVAFDEVGGMKVTDPDTVQIMRDYLANGRLTRGVAQVQAEASLAFVG